MAYRMLTAWLLIPVPLVRRMSASGAMPSSISASQRTPDCWRRVEAAYVSRFLISMGSTVSHRGTIFSQSFMSTPSSVKFCLSAAQFLGTPVVTGHTSTRAELIAYHRNVCRLDAAAK